MNKSRPVYAPFHIDPAARFHLIVTDRPEPPPSDDLPRENFDIWVVRTAAPGVPAPVEGPMRAFRAVAELLTHLKHRLAREMVGLRLYAVGAEAFLWDVHNLARAAGLASEEIRLHQAGPRLRRVYCTHCKTMIENAAVNVISCPGCGASLFVRDHFSRRLAAFMGVKIDAEVPGEPFVPEPFET
jgi:predicted RNA-binding Zn-ribbon protein involved in translation (DUF1610 family)